jgi:hypothetical protein
MNEQVNESILTSIKKLLGIAEDYEHFDVDLIIHINTFLTRLYQVGVGTKNFAIYDKSATWADFLGEDEVKFQQAKTYVYIRTKLLFDPPQSGAANEAFKEAMRELEWLLFVDADPGLDEVDWGGNSDGE